MAINMTSETIAQYMATQPKLSSKGLTLTNQSIAAHQSSVAAARNTGSAVGNTGALLLNNNTISSYLSSGGSGLSTKTSGGSGGTARGITISNRTPSLLGQSLQGGQSYSVNRTSSRSSSRTVPSLGTTSGAISQDGSPVPNAYLVKISSQKMGHTVVAILQQEVSMRVSSEWETFIPTGGITQLANALAQLTVKVSLQSRFTTRRIWKGTTPVEITLQFKFEAVDDSIRNVILPCQALMMMASPSSTGGVVPFLAPPGPSPYSVSSDMTNWLGQNQGNALWSTMKHVAEHLNSGDSINIQVGEFLSFSSVIIKDVNPVFATRMGVDGRPISAMCTVSFQTYEILTKDAIQGAFK